MHTHYIRDEYNEAYRVWNSNDPSDMFIMVPIKDFEPTIPALGTMSRHFVADFPEDDSGELVCGLCKAEHVAAIAATSKKRGRRAHAPR